VEIMIMIFLSAQAAVKKRLCFIHLKWPFPQ